MSYTKKELVERLEESEDNFVNFVLTDAGIIRYMFGLLPTVPLTERECICMDHILLQHELLDNAPEDFSLPQKDAPRLVVPDMGVLKLE